MIKAANCCPSIVVALIIGSSGHRRDKTDKSRPEASADSSLDANTETYIAPDAICCVTVNRRYLYGFTGVLKMRTS